MPPVWIRAFALVLTFSVFLTGPSQLLAQASQGRLAVSINSVDDRAFPIVRAAFTADARGQPLTEISPAETRIDENGAPVTGVAVQRAIDANIPLALVVTIDVSGSMEGDTLGKAKASAASLLNSLEPADRAAVLTFSNEVTVEQDLSGDRGALRATIERLRADGATALYDGVARSTEVAAASGFTRRVIILLSDGKESGDASRLNREASLVVAAEGGSPFYVVGVGPEIDREYLEQVATRSGGRYFEAAGAAQVPDVYAALQDLLRSQFVATFRATSSPEPRERSLRITVSRSGVDASAERAYTSLRPAPSSGTDEPQPGASLPATGVLAMPLVLGVLLVTLGTVVVRRRRALSADDDTETGDDPNEWAPEDDQELTARETTRPWSSLVVVGGPAGVQGRAADFRAEPITLGSAESCDLQLPAGSDVAAEHARLWLRDGKLMLHHLAAGRLTRIAGTPVIWASLESGDQFEVGPYILQWRMGQEDFAAQSADAEPRLDHIDDGASPVHLSARA